MRNITLKGGIGKYDISDPIHVPDTLNLTFSKPIANAEYRFEYRCGDSSESGKTNGVIDISLLSAGILELNIFAYIRGIKVATWEVEPLVVMNETAEFTTLPLLNVLRAEISSLQTIAEGLREENEALKNNIQSLESRIALLEGGYDPLKV